MASISVIITPVGTVPVAGKQVYHQTLVYTDSTGSYYISAGPTISNHSLGLNPASTAWNIASASLAVKTNTPSIWGTLAINGSGKFTPGSMADGVDVIPSVDKDTGLANANAGQAYKSQLLMSGTDAAMGARWATITSSYKNMEALHLTYSPFTQNSNSFSCTALTKASVPLPTGIGINDAFYTPGCVPNMATSPGELNQYLQSIFDREPITSTVDPFGNTVTTITDTGQPGNPSLVITANANRTGVETLLRGNTNNAEISGTGLIANISSTNVTFDADTGATIIGSGNTVAVGANDVATIIGGGNNINGTKLARINLSGTNGNFDILNYSNATNYGIDRVYDNEWGGIYLGADTQANVFGGGNAIFMGNGDSVGAYGGSNFITTGTRDLLVIGNTTPNPTNTQQLDSGADLITSNHNKSGLTTANGQGTGICLNSGAQATIMENGGDPANPTDVFEGDRVKLVSYLQGAGNIYANGTGDLNLVHGFLTNTYVNGNGSVTNVYGPNCTTYNRGNQDHTNNFGIAERNFNYGKYEFGWNFDPSDTNFNSDSTDGTDSTSWGAFWGFAGDKLTVAASLNSATGVLPEAAGLAGDNYSSEMAEMAKRQVVEALTAGQSTTFTGLTWAHRAISWSLADVGAQFSNFMGANERQAVQNAFDSWSAASGLTFQEVDDSAQSDIRIGWGKFDTANTGVVGYTNVATHDGKTMDGAVIRLEDQTQTALGADETGELAYGGTNAEFNQVLMHEIGHALGLADNADANSIESYYLNDANRQLDGNDIQAIRSLYGERAPAATGDTAPLIQAMASFSPQVAAEANLHAANDRTVHGILLAASR